MSDIVNMRAVAFGFKPLATLASPREAVRQFTPNWFAVTMGTGILALALAQFPVRIAGLRVVAEGLWLFNIALFSLFTVLYAARWIFYFDGARRIFGHSVVSMFFGCIPMGLATIINGISSIVRRAHTGRRCRRSRWRKTLWWADAAMALCVRRGDPFHDVHPPEPFDRPDDRGMAAAGGGGGSRRRQWGTFGATSGGCAAQQLTRAGRQAMRCGRCSVPLAMSILVILVLRMAIHKLPPASMAASSWLALGPHGHRCTRRCW